MTYPNGKTVKYTYDDMNRLIAVKGIDGATTKYEYDALGRRIATDGAKEDTVYAYDEVGNLVSQTTTGAYDLALEYAYDLSGRMTQESRTENGATLTSSYIYDALGQLTSFTRSDGQSETYTYDPVGNMTAKTQNGVSTAMRYNAANQLIQSVSGTDRTTYTYDANGNLVRSENAGGARSYAYNALNLLQSVIREDGYTETYTYNANRLLSTIKTSEDLTTTLTWDILYGDGVVISAAQNGESTNYTYGLERISALTGNTRTEYVYDGRGSVAAELSYNDAWYTFGGGLAKKSVTAKSYTPFGEQIGEATSGFGYNGEYYNAATGMIYLRARFYEPELNRFSQKDLLRGRATNSETLNRYLHCLNDPVNFVDPSGMIMRNVAVMMSDGGNGKNRSAASAGIVAGVAGVRSAAAFSKNAVSTVAQQPYGGYTASEYNRLTRMERRLDPTPPYVDFGRATGGACEIHAFGAGDFASTGVFSSYIEQSLRAFLFGDYSSAKPTWLSIGGNFAAGLLDVDIPLDIRDAIYDVSHANELEHPALRIGIDVVAFLPVIGGLKYVDDAADIIKHANDVADALDGVGDAARQLDNVGDAARQAGNTADALNDAAKIVIPKAEDLRMSQTVQNHIYDIIKKGENAGELSRPYIDSNGTVLLLQEIMDATDPLQDEFVKTALRWDVPGEFRGAAGIWELVVDTETNTVLHFNFVSN